MEAQQPQPSGDLGELERLLNELRERVEGLRATGLDAEQLQQRLGELDELAGRAATALDDVAR